MKSILKLKTVIKTPVFVLPNTDEQFKRVYGATLSSDRTEIWYPAFYPFYARVLLDLNQLPVPPDFSLEAAEYVKELDLLNNNATAGYIDPKFSFLTHPFQHQVESFKFAVYNPRSALLLDCGLGKTKTAIDLIRYHKFIEHGQSAIIVVPKVMLYKWQDEVYKHAGSELVPLVVDGTPTKKAKLIRQPADVYIMTYGSISQDKFLRDVYATVPYDCIILDESQNLQTYNSLKTRSSVFLASKAHRRMIMSGTVSLGDPRHLFGQLQFLGNFLIREQNYWKFCENFVVYARRFNRRLPIGYKNLDVLGSRLDNVSIKYTKEECLDLPDRSIIDLKYQPATDQIEAYNNLVSQTTHDNLAEDGKDTGGAAVRLIRLLQVLSGFYKQPDGVVIPLSNAKLEYCDELIDEILQEPTNKVIIWAHFIKELDDLEQLLKKKGIGYRRADGSTNSNEIQEGYQSFNTDPSCRVFCGQISTGVGRDLVAANYMIYYSLDFDLGHYLQSIDRNFRIGQTKKVIVYRLFAERAVDSYLIKALETKENIKAALLNESSDSEILRHIIRPGAI